jgi:hypothetical protein
MARVRRRHRRRRARRNPMMGIGPNPRRHRRHRRRRASYAMNPKRRRRRSRRYSFARHRYRRNPPAIRGAFNDALYAGMGYVGTKFAVGAVLPAVNISATPPSLTSIFAKFGVAYGVAYLFERFVGRGKFTPIFLGGAMSGIQDVVALYIAPSIPALAANDLSSYYRPPVYRLPAPQHGLNSYAGELSAEDML